MVNGSYPLGLPHAPHRHRHAGPRSPAKEEILSGRLAALACIDAVDPASGRRARVFTVQ
jgi:hypothetical protein